MCEYQARFQKHKSKKMEEYLLFLLKSFTLILTYSTYSINRFIYPLLKSSVLTELVIECHLETNLNRGMAWLQKGSETHNLVVSQITFSPLLSSDICIPTTKRPRWRWMDHLLSRSLKIHYLMQTWGRVKKHHQDNDVTALLRLFRLFWPLAGPLGSLRTINERQLAS